MPGDWINGTIMMFLSLKRIPRISIENTTMSRLDDKNDQPWAID